MTAYTFSQLFDFTRTTAATFVGSNGLIQNTPASVNLLTFTQEFDNAAWVKAQTTVTANAAAAPDGTLTADKMLETAVTNVHAVYANFTYIAGTIYAASVYAKAAERSWLYLGADTSAAEAVFFDLATGTVGSQGTGYVGSIQSVGDGWYRCTVIVTQATALPPNYFVVGVASANNTPSYAGVATSGLLIWGAQLELGSTATTYTRNNGGLFPARFEYDPVTLAPKGILIEEQRTNLLLQSQTFDSASWNASGATVSANVTASPDGAVNADKLVENSALGTHLITQVFTGTAVSHTFTVYAKAAERSQIRLRLYDGATFVVSTYFDLVTETVVGTGAITPAGNGWYRCSITATLAASAGCQARIHTAVANSDTYTGDGTSGVFIYGAQVEVGAFATSYIPTVASTVTRSADVCTITAPMFAPWYNQSTGTLVVDYQQQAAVSGDVAMASDGTPLVNSLGVYSASADVGWCRVGGVNQATISVSTTVTVPHKAAFAYAANDFALSSVGSAVVTDTSGTIPTVNQIRFGNQISGGQAMWLRRFTYYPFRASNNQLQALTT